MASVKQCDVCSGPQAETVIVSINAVNLAGQPVGTSQQMDLCATHRAQGVDSMIAIIKTDIEAAIIAP